MNFKRVLLDTALDPGWRRYIKHDFPNASARLTSTLVSSSFDMTSVLPDLVAIWDA